MYKKIIDIERTIFGQLYEQGKNNLSKGKYKEAINYFGQCIKINSLMENLFFLRGKTYLQYSSDKNIKISQRKRTKLAKKSIKDLEIVVKSLIYFEYKAYFHLGTACLNIYQSSKCTNRNILFKTIFYFDNYLAELQSILNKMNIKHKGEKKSYFIKERINQLKEDINSTILLKDKIRELIIR